MDLETSKNVGGIGAILSVVGPIIGLVSGWAGLLTLVGIIMVLVALKGLADHYNEGGIFNNALYALITGIVGVVVSIGAIVGTALVAIADLGITDWANPAEWTDAVMTGAFFSLIGAIIIGVVILFIFIVVACIFNRRSLNLLASKSGVGMFGTAGLLGLIGGCLSIILIGFLVMWVADILLVVAFFRLKPSTESSPTP